MNELTRYCVLIVALLNELLESSGLNRADPQLAPLLKELDALTMVLAHRGRAAINYHETSRGKHALNVADQVVDALRAGDTSAEWETRRWSLDQAGSAIFPGMKPDEVVHHERDLRGVALLSDFNETTTPTAEPA